MTCWSRSVKRALLNSSNPKFSSTFNTDLAFPNNLATSRLDARSPRGLDPNWLTLKPETLRPETLKPETPEYTQNHHWSLCYYGSSLYISFILSQKTHSGDLGYSKRCNIVCVNCLHVSAYSYNPLYARQWNSSPPESQDGCVFSTQSLFKRYSLWMNECPSQIWTEDRWTFLQCSPMS